MTLDLKFKELCVGVSNFNTQFVSINFQLEVYLNVSETGFWVQQIRDMIFKMSIFIRDIKIR